MDSGKAKTVIDAAKASMGMDISAVDLLNIDMFASRSGHSLIFYLVPFSTKSLICLEGKSMTPVWVNRTLFSCGPPSNSLVSVLDP